jgi:hypothetical protein
LIGPARQPGGLDTAQTEEYVARQVCLSGGRRGPLLSADTGRGKPVLTTVEGRPDQLPPNIQSTDLQADWEQLDAADYNKRKFDSVIKRKHPCQVV